MSRLIAVIVAVVISSVTMGCGNSGESDQLRAELSALKTQIAQPTVTASTIPTPLGTPTRTAEEEKELLADEAVGRIRTMIRYAQAAADSAERLAGYHYLPPFFEILDADCKLVPARGFNSILDPRLWPKVYVELDMRLAEMCARYRFERDLQSRDDPKLKATTDKLWISFATFHADALLSAIEALPDYSDQQLKRVLMDRQ